MDRSIKEPMWFVLGNELTWPLVGMALSTVEARGFSSNDYMMMVKLAVCHYANCLKASIDANIEGGHSAAIALIRQCFEALTIVDIGLQRVEVAEPILDSWMSGKTSHGEIRRTLEAIAWGRYGLGLWKESWSAFMGKFARAIQPYSHYSYELQGWQYQVLTQTSDSTFLALTGLFTYDALSATRVTLLHHLMTFVLGRIMLVNGGNADVQSRKAKITRLGKELGTSGLLFAEGEWTTQLTPHMLFRQGYDWRKNA